MEDVFLFAALFYLMYFRTDDATNSHLEESTLSSIGVCLVAVCGRSNEFMEIQCNLGQIWLR